MLIPRPSYLDQIRPFYGDCELVKVLVGMRRIGKSSLMQLIAEDIQSRKNYRGVPCLFYNMEDWANRHLLEADALHQEIERQIRSASTSPIIFLDEIQNVSGWELVVNSLRSRSQCSLFITGSNSRLLTGELATHLAGRYVRFEVFPFSFAEYLTMRQAHDSLIPTDTAFTDYIRDGGMPGLMFYQDSPESARTYLKDIFGSTVIKDIAQRWKIRETELLDRTILYMMEQIGHRLSGNAIGKFLKSENRKISVDSVINFMDAAVKTYLFHRVDSEDANGKQLFKFQPKFYITDHGLREAVLQSNQANIDQVLENIVYIELRRRQWDVHIGHFEGREVDFIARKGERTMYLQVAYLLASPETITREFDVLATIQDNYPKYVLSMDPIDHSRLGIIHRHIKDFLLDTSW